MRATDLVSPRDYDREKGGSTKEIKDEMKKKKKKRGVYIAFAARQSKERRILHQKSAHAVKRTGSQVTRREDAFVDYKKYAPFQDAVS